MNRTTVWIVCATIAAFIIAGGTIHFWPTASTAASTTPTGGTGRDQDPRPEFRNGFVTRATVENFLVFGEPKYVTATCVGNGAYPHPNRIVLTEAAERSAPYAVFDCIAASDTKGTCSLRVWFKRLPGPGDYVGINYIRKACRQ